MRQEILALVSPAAKKITQGTPKEISEGRTTLLQPMRDSTASPAFREAFSAIASSQLKDAAASESPLRRLNAMIVIAKLVDDGSRKMIDAGLKDQNPGVQLKAMEALRERVQYWLTQARGNADAEANVLAAVNQIQSMLAADPPPHPLIVAPAMRVFLDINTPDAHAALIQMLHQRVTLHAKDPSLAYHGEQAVLDRIARLLTTARPFPAELAKQTNRAAYRYALLINDQLRSGKISPENQDAASRVLAQSLTSLGQITAAAGKAPPEGQFQFKNWVQNGDWDEIQELIQAWSVVLGNEPFNLDDDQLNAG